jgi:hypothetical protein
LKFLENRVLLSRNLNRSAFLGISKSFRNHAFGGRNSNRSPSKVSRD